MIWKWSWKDKFQDGWYEDVLLNSGAHSSNPDIKTNIFRVTIPTRAIPTSLIQKMKSSDFIISINIWLIARHQESHHLTKLGDKLRGEMNLVEMYPLCSYVFLLSLTHDLFDCIISLFISIVVMVYHTCCNAIFNTV